MLIKDVELKTWGNSKAIRIGKAEMAELGLSDEEMNFTMVIDQGQITLTPKKKYPETIEELFFDYNGEALGEADRYEWDKPKGRELL